MRVGDPIIFSRIVNLFSVITAKKIALSIDFNVRRMILENFDVICELYMIGVTREDSISSDIYRISYTMICNAVRFTIHSQFVLNEIDNSDNISKLIQYQLSILNDTSNLYEDRYTRISNAMFFFNTLFNTDTIYHKIYDIYLRQIVDAYSKVMYTNSPIFEEGLIALDIIIQSIDEAGIDLLIKANELVHAGLSSESPSIITNSAYVRASIYNKYVLNKYPGYEELLDKFESNYEMIVDGCLSNDRFTREYYPILLKAVALIIRACSEYIREKIPGIIDSFVAQYEHFVEMPICVENDDDLSEIEYANIFYDAMFTFAKSIMMCVTNKSGLSMNRRFMRLIMVTIPEAYFKNLEFNFSSNSLISFYEFIKQFIKTFKERGNIIVNRKVNYKIMYNGLLSKDRKVKSLSNETISRIKNA